MSDYSGPYEQCKVRFIRSWELFKETVPAGFIADATYYPELGSYHVKVGGGQTVGNHPRHIGLIERVKESPNAK